MTHEQRIFTVEEEDLFALHDEIQQRRIELLEGNLELIKQRFPQDAIKSAKFYDLLRMDGFVGVIPGELLHPQDVFRYFSPGPHRDTEFAQRVISSPNVSYYQEMYETYGRSRKMEVHTEAFEMYFSNLRQLRAPQSNYTYRDIYATNS